MKGKSNSNGHDLLSHCETSFFHHLYSTGEFVDPDEDDVLELGLFA